jgi:hypothetical protein
MSDWPFPDEVKTAVDIMRREMEEDEEAWPRLLTFFVDGKGTEWHHIDPNMMADWRDKNKIGLIIVRQCFRADVRCCIFLSDTFGTFNVDPALYARLREQYGPDFYKWPREYIQEALLVVVNAPKSEGVTLQAHYTRDAHNKRVFTEIERMPLGLPGSRNRFQFDLRDVTEHGAMWDALLRGREGTVKADA